jgi:hypothetical protein
MKYNFGDVEVNCFGTVNQNRRFWILTDRRYNNFSFNHQTRKYWEMGQIFIQLYMELNGYKNNVYSVEKASWCNETSVTRYAKTINLE